MKGETAARRIFAAYLFILMPFISWWAPHGYSGLGGDKFLIYRLISVIFALVLLPFVFFSAKNGVKRRVAAPDAALMVYALLLTVSFIFSCDKAEALWGTAGWRMGYITQLLALFFYFAARVFKPSEETVFFSVLISSVPTVAFGVLNRFGIYPLMYMGADDSFISTIGNINWYGGYLCAATAVSLGFFVSSGRRYIRISAAALFALCSLSVVTQGADGTTLAFLAGVIAAAAGAALIRTADGADGLLSYKRLILAALIFGLCLEACGVLSVFFDGGLRYGADNRWLGPARDHFGLVTALIAIVIMALLKRFKPVGGKPKIAAGVLILVLAAGAVLLFLIIVSMAAPGAAGGIAELFGAETGDAFGNGRGGVWRVSGEYLRRLGTLRKLVGVGPDCFAVYGYSDERISRALLSTFGAARLTNAHSELFTAAINTGIPSAFALAAFYILSFIRLLSGLARRGKNEALVLSAFICLVSLTALQSLSFPTVCAWPFMLILTGAAI